LNPAHVLEASPAVLCMDVLGVVPHPWGGTLSTMRIGTGSTSKGTDTPTGVEAWERRAEVPLLLLAVAFLVAYAWPVIDSSLDRNLRGFLDIVSWTVWGAFVVDFLVRLALAERRRTYALHHWYDVAMILLPMLRPLRLLRLLAFMRVLNRSAVGSRAGQATTYVVGTAVFGVGLGAVAVLDAEQDASGANITTLGDALWWATTTAVTVGYGDRFPVTTTGRLIAVALMLVGVAVVGVVTASIAAWFIGSVENGPPARHDDQA
jgi:voltage-gated potassium channel